jgi:hypothetical protein
VGAWLLAALAASSSGCDTSVAGRTDGGADAERQADAGLCSIPRLSSYPAVTHRAAVAYDELLAGAASVGSYPGNDGVGIFLDQAGVAFFGMNSLFRVSREGHLMSTSPIPLASGGESSMGMPVVVEYPDGYAAILGEALPAPRRFCRIAGDSWPSPDSCPEIPNTTYAIAWDGSAFQLFSRGKVATYDATGAWVMDRPFPQQTDDEWPRAAWFLGDNVLFDWYGLGGQDCYTENLWVLPRSLDVASGTKYDAEAADFLPDWVRGVGTETFAAFLALGPCFTKPSFSPSACSDMDPYWPGAFLTVIGVDGQPEVLRQSLPIATADQLAWDGENLVAIRAQGDEGTLHLYVISRQGTMVGVSNLGPSELGFGSWKYPSHALVVAVAPNDYIVIYNTAQLDTYAARFQLVPLQ